MKSRIFLLCLLSTMLMIAQSSTAQASANSTAESESALIAGVWRGVWGGDGNGLPCISLTVTGETGKLSGAILFYLLRRDPGQAATSTPGIPEPLIDPKFGGKTLSFQVSHRRAHPPNTMNDPPINFRLTLTGKDKAALNNVDNPVGDGAGSSGIPMVRTDY
jgi:hypothetical protein